MAYQTKPLENWGWAKEIRAKHYENLRTAKEKGKYIVAGSGHSPKDLIAGIGDFAVIGGEPWGASVAVYPDLASKCMEEVERRGFARDLCVYMRQYWGSMFLNTSWLGGEFPKPDFIIQTCICDQHAKWYQVVADYLGTPSYCVDAPYRLAGVKAPEATIRYLANSLNDIIEWLVKLTGKEYNDEKLIEGVSNNWRTRRLWAEIMMLNKAIPAPLDLKSIYSLYLPGEIEPWSEETVRFYRALKDEVQYRVDNQIATVPEETCRFMHDGPPPWYALNIFRYLQSYGAVGVASTYVFGLPGIWDLTEEGGISPGPLLEEVGVPRNREEALRVRALIDCYTQGIFFNLTLKPKLWLNVVHDWNCDGAIFHINRGCEGMSLGLAEAKLAVASKVPAMLYEGNMGDKKDWDEARVMNSLETFIASLGLKKLPEYR